MGKHCGNAEVSKMLDVLVDEFGWEVERRRDHVVAWAPGRIEKLTVSGGKHVDPEYLRKLKGKIRKLREAKESRT